MCRCRTRAESAAARRFDRQHVARLDFDRELAAEIFARAGAGSLQCIAARGRGRLHPDRTAQRPAAFREHRHDERAQEFESSHDAVAAAMLAGPARAATNAKLVDADRVTPFDDFGIGQPRVRHVRVDGVGTVGVGVAPLPPQIVS